MWAVKEDILIRLLYLFNKPCLIDIVIIVFADIHEVHHSIRNALRFLFCSYIFHDHISIIIVHKDSDYFDMMKREAETTDEIGHFFLLALFCKVKTIGLLD